MCGLLVLTLTSCDSPPAAPPAAAGSPSGPAATPSVAPTTPPPSSPAVTANALGRTVDIDGGDGIRVTATVYAYRQPSAPGATSPGPGLEWASADVQMCLRTAPAGTTIGVSQRPWRFAYRDGRTAEFGSVTYQQFPSPAYPNDQRPISAGRCVRGWLTFPVPTGERPAWVEYAPEGAPVTDWTVP
jgi:peptidoglycan hydrolase-like protein with peptidoglycan-binding domain